jgi:predicted GTPase
MNSILNNIKSNVCIIFSEMDLLVFVTEKKYNILSDIADLTLQLDKEKKKMIAFMNESSDESSEPKVRFISAPIGRKSAPVSTNVFKLWRVMNGKLVNVLTG